MSEGERNAVQSHYFFSECIYIFFLDFYWKTTSAVAFLTVPWALIKAANKCCVEANRLEQCFHLCMFVAVFSFLYWFKCYYLGKV